eukprot:30444-Eustigmatos_ZCMA.PRE.1
MGAYTSSRIVSKEAAAELLGPNTSRRLEEGMKRLAPLLSYGSNGNGYRPPAGLPIDRKTFQRYVLD